MKPRVNSLQMTVTVIAATTALIIFSTASFAQTHSTDTETFENVEELMDNIDNREGERVRVSGKIEEIDGQTFILESGGIFNDEIVVIIPKEKKEALWAKDESKATVTGVIRTLEIVQVEREYGLDLDPEIEVELERIKTYLIADHIQHKEGEC